MDSLDEVRASIRRLAADLDPGSRYLPELLAIVDASRDVADLVKRLEGGCRGSRHAGAEVFARMTLEQKLRANLVTNETVLFRFNEGEWEVLQSKLVPRFARKKGRVLCAPCSHGEEVFSVAAACLQVGVDFEIDGVDIQPECIAEGKAGRLTMGFPRQWLETPAIVAGKVREKTRFQVADLLLDPGAAGGPPEGRWDLIVCRNFLGYFVEPVAVRIASVLAGQVEKGGALFLDGFCLGKLPAIEGRLQEAGFTRDDGHPVFLRG